MSEFIKPSPQEAEPQNSSNIIYRGVGPGDDRERAGAWWTTNPYYALAFTRGGGTLFVSKVGRDVLDGASDVSQDEYPNYGFPDADPPGVRVATEDEIAQLRALGETEAPVGLSSDLPGGQLQHTPDNPIAAGEQVFSHTFE